MTEQDGLSGQNGQAEPLAHDPLDIVTRRADARIVIAKAYLFRQTHANADLQIARQQTAIAQRNGYHAVMSESHMQGEMTDTLNNLRIAECRLNAIEETYKGMERLMEKGLSPEVIASVAEEVFAAAWRCCKSIRHIPIDESTRRLFEEEASKPRDPTQISGHSL